MFRMLPVPACAKALPWDEVGQLEIILLLSRRGSRARRATDLQDKPVQVFLDCFLRRIWAFGSFEFSLSRVLGHEVGLGIGRGLLSQFICYLRRLSFLQRPIRRCSVVLTIVSGKFVLLLQELGQCSGTCTVRQGNGQTSFRLTHLSCLSDPPKTCLAKRPEPRRVQKLICSLPLLWGSR